MVRLGSDIGGIDLNPGETITVGDQVYELTEDGELRGVDSLRVEEAGVGLQTEPRADLKESYPKRQELVHIGQQISGFDDLTEWDEIEGTIEAETDIVYRGQQSARLSDPNYDHLAVQELDRPMDVSGLGWSIAYYPTETGDTHLMRVTLEDSDGNQTHYDESANSDFVDDWIRLDLSPSDYQDADDEFDPTDVVEIRIEGAWSRGDIIVDDLRTVPQPDKSYLILTFDDGFETHYTNVFPILAEYGWLATFFITSGWIGDSDKMAWEQVDEIYDAGHDVSNHSHTHPAYFELTKEEQREEIETCKRMLLERGYTRSAHYHNTPGGDWDANTLDLMDEYQMTSWEGGTAKAGTNPIPTEPRALRNKGGDDFSAAIDRVDFAAENNLLLSLLFHDITDTSGFREVMDRIKEHEERGDLEVISRTEYHNRDDINPYI
jgi:peptidoglycan/xylan/chitin deacetylase (PgdA/CDA1 family)